MSDAKNTTSGRRLSFPGKQKVQIELFELPPLQEGEVLVKTSLSLMSTGTENIVFNQLFEPGTHWDNWVKYPFCPGYCAVGTVLESRGKALKAGDRVTARSFHQSHWVGPESGCSKIPDSVPFENTHFFKPADCAQAYETVNRERARTMGVVFDWREEA
jgi:NADPH:quinone reductase-like Zn-dependent oxidoreductase